MVSKGKVREIDVYYSAWCIFELRVGGSAVPVEVEGESKEEPLRSLVVDWGLFGLLLSYL